MEIIFSTLLEPELLEKLENDGSPTVPLADREIYTTIVIEL